MIKKLLLSALCLAATTALALAQETTAAPEACYLVGGYNDWTLPSEENVSTLYTLTDEDLDGIYKGKFNFAADEFDFKIFLGIADWNQSGMYFGTEEAVTMDGISTSKAYEATAPGSKNFTCKDWPGGEVEISYNFYESTVAFSAAINEIGIYIWDPYSIVTCPKAYETSEGVYSTTFKTAAVETIYFQFLKGTEIYCPTENTTVEFSGDVFTGNFQTVTGENQSDVPYWTINNFQGGELTFTIDFNTNTVTVKQTIIEASNCYYVVGQFSGWMSPDSSNEVAYQNYRLVEQEPGIFMGEFEIAAGEFIFRLYKELTGWDGGDSYGCQAEDNPMVFDIPFEGNVVQGKGSWQFPWAGGKAKIVFEESIMMLYVSDATNSIEEIGTENGEAQFFNLQGVRVANPENGLYIRVQNGKATKVIL